MPNLSSTTRSRAVPVPYHSFLLGQEHNGARATHAHIATTHEQKIFFSMHLWCCGWHHKFLICQHSVCYSALWRNRILFLFRRLAQILQERKKERQTRERRRDKNVSVHCEPFEKCEASRINSLRSGSEVEYVPHAAHAHITRQSHESTKGCRVICPDDD